MKHNEMLAMILAGGRGSRLHELTNKVAKPAVGYGGKYRIIDFPISNCANSGIDVVGISAKEFRNFRYLERLNNAPGILKVGCPIQTVVIPR